MQLMTFFNQIGFVYNFACHLFKYAFDLFNDALRKGVSEITERK